MFCGVFYAGKFGWLNSAEKPTAAGRIPVIVALDDGLFSVTTVNATSVRRASHKPSLLVEACMYQKHDLNTELRLLCDKMAKCRIGKAHVDDARQIFVRELTAAIERQEKKGSKAMYYDVKYSAPAKKHARSFSIAPTHVSSSGKSVKSNGSKSDASKASRSSMQIS